MIVDPGDRGDLIIECCKREGLDVKAILLTHGHSDHIGALDQVKKAFGAKVYALEDEKELMADENLNLSKSLLGTVIRTEADVWLRDNETVNLIGLPFQVIATPGCESNVKEIFDKTHELRQEPDCMIFNQFEEMGNHLWHYQVTGSAIAEVFEAVKRPGDRLSGACFTSGSAGTIGCGDYLKEVYPGLKLAVGEALQCPTILENGFGDHRIEGIGDKHIPWIHNVKNTDMVIDIDDEDSQRLLRLFNDPAGHDYLREAGVPEETLSQLSLLGISGIANVLCCVKLSKYYELTEHDVVATVLTDSADMYRSRIQELADQYGPYDGRAAAVDHALHLLGLRTDAMAELNYYDRKRVHNLKYYTWVEQQGRDMHELNDLWYGSTWDDVHRQAAALDELITAFNEETGVLKRL